MASPRDPDEASRGASAQSATASRPEARQLLALARKEKARVEAALAKLPLELQIALVCDAPIAQRTRLLELLPQPEAVVPQLPEAELVFTVKAVGLDDSTWLLEHATQRQLATCFDLDAWKGLEPERKSLSNWFAVLAEAGDDTLFRSVQAIDTELLVLFMREHVHVMLDPKDEVWQPPEGAQTLEGQFYFVARDASDDLAPLLRTLHVVFQRDYWLYFRLMQAVMWEMESDLEEWALRWRNGRIADLGFPSWEESMRIYGFLRPEQRTVLAEAGTTQATADWDLPVWIPNLPALSATDYSIFRAAAELDEGGRRSFFYAFVALANKIAIADRMPLGDAETLPKAIEKTADFGSLGLAHIATECGVSEAEALSRTTVDHLFRVGANLEPERARVQPEDDAQTSVDVDAD